MSTLSCHWFVPWSEGCHLRRYIQLARCFIGLRTPHRIFSVASLLANNTISPLGQRACYASLQRHSRRESSHFFFLHGSTTLNDEIVWKAIMAMSILTYVNSPQYMICSRVGILFTDINLILAGLKIIMRLIRRVL